MTQSNTKKAIDVTKLVPPKTVIYRPKKYIDDYQFNVLGNITTDSSTSCDLEDAVAKMIGWLSGSLRIHPDDIDIRNITLAQMPYLPFLHYSLDDHIEMLIEKAGDNLIAADKDPEVSQEIKAKTIEAVRDCEDLSSKVLTYKCAIDTELAKGKKSALKIDTLQTKEHNKIFITLDSLNKWANKNYQIRIHGDMCDTKKNTQKSLKTPQRMNALRAEIIPILKNNIELTPGEVMSILRSRVGNLHSCIIGNIGDGSLKWESDTGKENIIDIKKLTERIRTEKNRLRQD